MEKQLLLLGLLISHEMHGYQLNEMLQANPASSIKITKSNAYRILKSMEEDGWVRHQEEREGNLPTRQVYSVTAAGQTAFLGLLRENLASFPTPELPGVVGLDFVHALPRDEVLALLQKRRLAVEARYNELNGFPQEIRTAHLSISYMHNFYASEMAWLTDTISQLASES